MDSRDIQEEPIQVVGGNYLGCIYQLQKELLEGYIGIEGLPQYPIDVNTKKSQVLLKDFTGRVIEELAEGYEAMLQVEELTVKNKFWVDSYDGNDLTQCLNHLQNVGEEMADSLHFMLELLIYANIEPEDINSFVNTWLEKHAPEVYKKVKGYDTISKAMIMGSTLILHDRVLYQDSGRKYVDLIKVYENTDSDDGIPEMDTRFLKCCHKFNGIEYHEFQVMMWKVTYHLNIARNFLKNKPWKQSQVMTQELEYQKELTLGFITMMGLFYQMGLTVEDLYFLYFKKNRVNLFRQKSKY